jgi:DNA polymerase III alpha subunit
MKFTHLHVHTHYSLLDGLSKIDELLDYVKENNMDSVAITDHGVLYGAVEFFKKAKKKGIKPIIGCEVYVAEKSRLNRNQEEKNHHLILLAKNKEGYKNLCHLITASYLEGFYYKPRVDEEILKKHGKGLIALSGCIKGKIPSLILNKKDPRETIKLYQKIFDSFYLELQHHANLPDQEKVNKELIKLSKEMKVPLVATSDSHYLRPEDADAHDILVAINTGSTIHDENRLSMRESDLSLPTPEEMAKRFKHVPEALENTTKIAKECCFEFTLGVNKMPHFDLPEKTKNTDYLQKLCLKGLKEKYNNSSQAKQRMDYELGIINKVGFTDYFLIVHDFVKWSRDNRIVVGPGRGSIGGSIVAYLIDITNIDPLKYNLLFERFLNPERISMPDIDLDFADRRREEVIQYVTKKYGQERVAQIITFGTMAARGSIRDVGRALGLPYAFCDQTAKMVPFGMSLSEALEKSPEFSDLYKENEEARELIDFARQLEGVARHASTHACGVVIAAEPLTDLVPLQKASEDSSTSTVTQYELHAVEDIGLLKMDFLGLKNLTVIEDTIKKIFVVHKKKIDINEIPLDDKKTYQLFQRAETVGVFQLECLAQGTMVDDRPIEKIRKGDYIKSYLNNKIIINEVLDSQPAGQKEVWQVKTEKQTIEATPEHSFLTNQGWKKLKEINNEELITEDLSSTPIISITPVGLKPTYDIMMKEPADNFIANGLVVHNSGGMQRYLKLLKPTCFEDIIAMVALYRPGPMEFIPDYIACKHGEKEQKYPHPVLKPILQETYSIPVYQEQIMRIAQDLAGFTLSEADILRKAMGKKIKELLMELEDKFIEGAINNKIEKEIAQKIWEWIIPFASYGFNKSHSTGYAMIAYQTAYLKTHYPVEFMASLLTSDRNDTDKISKIIEDCRRMKIKVLPPDVNESFIFFGVVPQQKQIRFGLAAIKNMGFAIAEQIVEERKLNGPYTSIANFAKRLTFNKKSLEALIKAGALDDLGERNQLLENMEEILRYSRKKNDDDNQGTLFGGGSSDLNLKEATPAKKSEKLKWEKELLGLFITSHPLEEYQAILADQSRPINEVKQAYIGERVRTGGLISSIKKIMTKKGDLMAFVNLEDMNDRIELVLFPKTWRILQNIFIENKIAVVSGKLDYRDNAAKIICDSAEEIYET